MPDTVGIGIQDFGDIRRMNNFYVDKTHFIKEWWESNDIVTLITRPRRFGKTLMMSMLDHFLSVNHKEDAPIFEGLDIWKDEKYRKLQGTYPVIYLSFANIKENSFIKTVEQVNNVLTELVDHHIYHNESILRELTPKERKFFDGVSPDMGETAAEITIHNISNVLSRYYEKKAIILLDEYDTPMQEAYVNGFWDELVSFTRGLFNATFKTNPYLERAVMTGITRVSRESIFSDLNNLRVITATSTKYETSFGFTEDEVFKAMDTYGYRNKEDVKYWYDGFTFGRTPDIYNPWSVINFLSSGELRPYWANTSSNSLVSNLIREGDVSVKLAAESLMKGETIWAELDEEIAYDQLNGDETAIWSLLLAGGYLKISAMEGDSYGLVLTNHEVKWMFQKFIRRWFSRSGRNYSQFIKALLSDDLEGMNEYMNGITEKMFSFFDVGGSDPASHKKEKGEESHKSEWKKPEQFYHGFVLGLLVELDGRYEVTSNRESGLGRYDVALCPLDRGDDAVIIEFKAQNPGKGENTLADAVESALAQIEDKRYEAVLVSRGIPKEKIRKYGFAFCGKDVLIG